jgi:AcrR family transcriptional regulator
MSRSAAAERSAKFGDIVTAAQELFGQVGYDKAGVREIALRAHIALGTLYSYFNDGKIGVLTAALNERVERLTAYVAETDEADPLEAFLDRVRRLNGEIVRDPFLRRLFTDADRLTEPRLRERGREIIDFFSTAAIEELRRLSATGLARCEDPEAVETLLRVANIGWIVTQSHGSRGVDHDRFLGALIESVRALIRPT